MKTLLLILNIVLFVIILIIGFENIMFIYPFLFFFSSMTSSITIPLFIMAFLGFINGALTGYVIMLNMQDKNKNNQGSGFGDESGSSDWR